MVNLCLVNVNMVVVKVLTRDKVLVWGKGALCAVEDIGGGGLIFENKTQSFVIFKTAVLKV